jgi:hypothetical protein
MGNQDSMKEGSKKERKSWRIQFEFQNSLADYSGLGT